MSTSYPGAIDSYTTKTDGVDSVMAADVNNLQDAVVAVQTQLGANFDRELKYTTIADATIASGEITPSQGYIAVIPETGTSDTLSTINGGVDGKVLALRPKNSGDTITLDTGGNISVGIVLDDQADIAFLVYSSALSKWCLINPPSSGGGVATDPIWATKGDLAVGTGDDTASILSVGTNGQKFVSASGETEGVNWIDDTFVWAFPMDASLTAEIHYLVPIPYDCTITAVQLVADQTGSAAADIWTDTWANFPPTIADTITSSTPPTLSSAQKVEDSTLTSWTVNLTKGNYLAIYLTSATTVTWVVLSIIGKKTAVS